MVNTKSFSKSNAVPTTFGFEFQALVGLVLLLENLEDVNGFSIEGPVEDVELELNNGKYIYAQVKSKEKDILVRKSNFDKLKDGLKTLNEASKHGDAEKLIYVSNTYYPLGTDKIFDSFWLHSSSKSKYSYTDEEFKNVLPKRLENIFNTYAANNPKFKRELFSIYFYKFLNSSDRYTKYEVFYQEIQRYISKIGDQYSKFYKEIYDRWYTFIRQSETSRNDYSKEDFLWQLVELLSARINKENFLEYLDIDDEEFDEIIQTYIVVLENIEGRFELSNKILNKFQEMKKSDELGNDRKQKIFIFIDRHWKSFKDEIFLSDNENDEEIIVKYAIWKIIANKRLINKVRKSANI